MEQTPLYLQSKVIPAKYDRQLIESIFGGVEQVTEGLAVSSVSGYTVSVAAGRAVVVGDVTIDGVDPGAYFVVNPVAKQLTPVPHATNPRIDRVVFRVYDSTEIGSGPDQAIIELVPGTATAGADLTNENGIAAVPNSAISIAKLLVPASGGSIGAGQIEDDRSFKPLITGPNVADLSLPLGKLDAAALALIQQMGSGRGHSVIAGEHTTNSALFTKLGTTPGVDQDQVSSVVVPANGKLRISYLAAWKNSTSATIKAAVFIGTNQLRSNPVDAADLDAPGAAEISQAVGGVVGPGQIVSGQYAAISTAELSSSGSTASDASFTAFPTTGLIIPAVEVFVAAGTYNVWVGFKTTAGTLSVKDRKLFVEAIGF